MKPTKVALIAVVSIMGASVVSGKLGINLPGIRR